MASAKVRNAEEAVLAKLNEALEAGRPAGRPIDNGEEQRIGGTGLDVEIRGKRLRIGVRPVGFDAKIAANGRKALQLAETEPFDIVISDQQMPEMTLSLRRGARREKCAPRRREMPPTSPRASACREVRRSR